MSSASQQHAEHVASAAATAKTDVHRGALFFVFSTKKATHHPKFITRFVQDDVVMFHEINTHTPADQQQFHRYRREVLHSSDLAP